MRFDNNGVLFVGTDKGLARFDGEKFSPVAIGVKDAAVSMVYFNAENHMFVGVGNSMLEFDGKKKLSEKKFSSKLVGFTLLSANVGTGRSLWKASPEFSAIQSPAFTWILSAAFGSARTRVFVFMMTIAIGSIIQKSSACRMHI